MCGPEKTHHFFCSLCNLSWSQAQDKTTRLWYVNKNYVFPVNKDEKKLREENRVRCGISQGIAMNQDIIFLFLFFFLLCQNRCFCVDKFYLFGFLCGCDFPGASQNCLFFLYGQKGWAFPEWRKIVDKINRACFSCPETISKTASTLFTKKCGFWKG